MELKKITRKKRVKRSGTAIVAIVFLLTQMIAGTAFAADGDVTGSFAAKAPPTVTAIEAKSVTAVATVTGANVTDVAVANLAGSGMAFTINGTMINFAQAVVEAWTSITGVSTAIQTQLTAAASTVVVTNTGAGGHLVLTGAAGDSITISFLSGLALTSIGLAAGTTAPVTGHVDALTPGSSYNIEVTVSDPDGIGTANGGLATVVTKMWYDALGTDKAVGYFDFQTVPSIRNYANITWTRATNTAAISAGAGTDWTLISSTLPTAGNLADPALTSFKLIYQVKVSEIATEASDATMKWHLAAKATDTDVSDHYLAAATSLDMNWYGKIAVAAGTVADWGRISAGLAFADAAAKKTIAGITFLANGVYDQSIKAASTFSNDTGGVVTTVNRKLIGATAADTFSIESDTAGTYNVGTSVPIAEDGTTVAPITADVAASTTLTPVSVTNNLYLSVNPTFANTGKVYSGTITYVIANS